jgi:dihydroxyacid dehydratase/phosphogluconate dehydratase
MKAAKEEEQMAKIREERSLITSGINALFKTADMVAVDTEYKEVSLSVYPEEFDRSRTTLSCDVADFRLEKSDKETYSLYYSYTIKEK